MRHIETFDANASWYTKLTNNSFFCIDDQKIKTVGVALGSTDATGKWDISPKISGNDHQFYNSVLFARVTWPPSVFVQVRWTDKVMTWPTWVPLLGGKQVKQLFQGGIGWKNTGRFAILARAQTDASAAAGYHVGLPNTDQAQGWTYGGH